MDITIEYNKAKCIGAGKCAEVAGNYFHFDGEKAILLHAIEKNGKSVYRVDLNLEQLEKVKDAGFICPVNAIKVSETGGQVLVSDTIEIEEKLREIRAEYNDLKEFVMDEKGYFLIRINQDIKEIEVAFCPQVNKITVIVRGAKPIDIYQTIIKQGLISREDHAAYLGRELQKAYIALQKNILYVQDDELVF